MNIVCQHSELRRTATTTRNQITRVVLCLVALWAGGLILNRVQAQSGMSGLSGVIDIHTHSSPDNTARSIGVIELAKLAKERGMRGLVIKSHNEPTASLAYIVRQLVPGLEVFGGIAMDLSNGGINPAAVENMTKVTGKLGRIVWMPTFDSEASVKMVPGATRRPFVSVVQQGQLLPAVKNVLAIIAANDLVLATGHLSAEEVLLVVREATAHGVGHIVVTHAMNNPTRMTVAQMKEAASFGAYIEFCYLSTLGERPRASAAEMARAMREVGPAHSIMSTDLGQPNNQVHTDGFATFIETMRREGLSDAELSLMTRDNPASLLGLKPSS